MTNLDEILAKQKEYLDLIKSDGQKALKNLFLSFFDNNSEIEALRWCQYTPYFNDGDECIFGVNDFEVKLKKEVDEGFLANYEIRRDHGNLDINLKKFQKLFKGQNDLLKMIFGDHAEITATREEFIIESFEHE